MTYTAEGSWPRGPTVAAGYDAARVQGDARRRLSLAVLQLLRRHGNAPRIRAAVRRALDGLAADLEARYVQRVGEAEVMAEIEMQAVALVLHPDAPRIPLLRDRPPTPTPPPWPAVRQPELGHHRERDGLPDG